MVRLAAAVRRHPRLVLLAWVALLLAAVPFVIRQGEHLSGAGFDIPGSEADAVDAVLEQQFPRLANSPLAVVLAPRPGAPRGAVAAAVARVQRATRGLLDASVSPASIRRALAVAGRGGPALVLVRRGPGGVPGTDTAATLRERLAVGQERDGVVSYLVGQRALLDAIRHETTHDVVRAERTGFPVVLVVLLAAFGSLAAAALPLLLGVASVALTGALIFFLSQAVDMSVFVINMASMIGIGVAVDYSLFVLARYREEMRAGSEPDRALTVAMATSGRAVAFSGATVITSLAGLWLIDNQIIRSMALGAIMVVAVSVLASATLLPALIRVMGARAHARGRLARRLWRSDAERVGWWTRWTRRVTARPAAWALGAGGVMVLLTVPAFSLDTASGTLRQFEPGDQVRVGFAQAAKVIRLGALAPADVVVRPRPGADPAAVAAAVRARASADPEVAAVGAPLVGSDGRTLLVRVTPRSDAESDAAHAMVGRLRDTLPAAARGRAEVLVGGTSAAQRDLDALVGGSLWRIFLFVPLLSFLVLVVLLRSIVLPLKAAFTTLLSVGASYGVLVAVFQWGWFDGFLGFHSPGRVDTVIPPLVVGIVFGLSMDYEVFLLARIRERWQATGDPRAAVAEGLAASAPTITSAALIMVAVFAVFVGTGVASVKEVGLGCAVAVGLDATVVRLVLVPATMELLGARNWWLPRALARLLPRSRAEAVAA